MRVLVVNAGSSSLKLRLLDDSDARTLVITAREDLQIAHEVRWLLRGGLGDRGGGSMAVVHLAAVVAAA